MACNVHSFLVSLIKDQGPIESIFKVSHSIVSWEVSLRGKNPYCEPVLFFRRVQTSQFDIKNSMSAWADGYKKLFIIVS